MSETPPPFNTDKFVATQQVPFNLGKLLSATVSMMRAHWLFLAVTGLCVVVLPKLALVGTHLYFHSKFGDEESAYVVLNLVEQIFDYAWSYLLQIAIVLGLTSRAIDQKLTPGGIASLLGATILMTILSNLGTIIGLLLLIIPGLLLLVRWSLAGPILVAERVGSMQSMGRSGELTRGYFWPILGGLFVCVIFSIVWAAAFEFAGAALLAIWPDDHIDWIVTALSAPWADLIYGVFTVTLYFHVVALKEGGNDDTVAAVFD
jgi:hypothetical protein